MYLSLALLQMSSILIDLLEKIKIGNGYDVHAFEKGRNCIIGGVKIPYEMGLKGHSDADVLIHAIIDSLLGASGHEDIGELFADDDEAYKNISSLILLEKTAHILDEEKWKIINIDCVIICEQPKIKEYKSIMKKNISGVLGITLDQIGIKGKTSEKLGFTGRQEGIAVSAVSLIYKTY